MAEQLANLKSILSAYL